MGYKSLVITKVDKVSGVVILDCQDYVNKIDILDSTLSIEAIYQKPLVK